MNGNKAASEVKVWDPLIRIFHWTLVISFVVAYASGDELAQVHVWSGYLITGLLVFRLVWGFVGPKHARFSDFLYSRREIAGYLKSLLSTHPKRYLGHNPAGGAMIFLLLGSLALTVATGLPMIDGSIEALEEVHEFFANLTLLLVIVHIAGVVMSGRLHHENLVRAMITGRKPAAPREK